MNGIPFFEWPVSSIVAEQLGWVLVHTVWQFALLALVARVTVGAMCRTSARARYGALLVATSITLAAPVVTWILQNAGAPRQAITGVVTPKVNANVAPAPELDPPSTNRVVQFGTEEHPSRSQPIASEKQIIPPVVEPAPHPPLLDRTWTESIALRLRPWLGWIDALWLAGVLVCSARPLLGWHVLRRLQRVGTSPASDEVVETLRRVAMRLGIRHAVKVLQSTLTQVPIVVGYFRPVILLPVSLMTTISAAQLEALLAHELAHVRRHDFVVNLLQSLLETLFFYHPAIWWLSHRIRVEREHCCDDLVVRLFDNRVEYGRALVAVEELRGRSTVLALGAADGSLLARVRRIAGLGEGTSGIRVNSRWPVALASLAIALATFVSLTFAAKNGQAGSSQPAIATLPGNITVELIGVGFQPPGEIWWRADGSKLQERPISGRAEWGSGEPGRADCREFALRMSGLRDAPSVYTDFGGKSHSTAGTYSDGEWSSVHGAGPFELGFLKPRTTSILVGLTTDPFGPTVAIDPFGKRLSGDDIPTELKPFYDRFVPLSVEDWAPRPDEEARVGIKLLVDASQWQALQESAAWELDAFDVDGKKYPSTSSGGNYYLGFDIPRERLTRIEFRLRPYRHWVTFENVSLQPERKTKVKVSVESTPGLVVGAPLFADELLLHLTPELAHDRHWFFVDLDQGRLVKPPFRVELSIHVPFFSINPPEEQLTRWLAENGVDLLIFVGPARTGDETGRWSDIVCTRFVRTKMEYVNDLLVPPDRSGEAWRFQDLPADLLTRFARQSDAPQKLDFVPFASANHALTSRRPDAYGFRTAENVVGAFLLERTNSSKEELTLRIAQLIGATTPLDDLDFAGHAVTGKHGASDPPRLAEPLIAKLPGGLEVELVGVTKNTAPVADGWTPKGRPLEEVATWPSSAVISMKGNSTTISGGGRGTPDRDARDLLVRMRGLKGQPSFQFLDYLGARGWSHLPMAESYLNRLSIRLNTPAEVSTLKFGITDAPWGPMQRVHLTGNPLDPVELDDFHRPHYAQLKVERVGPSNDDPTRTVVVFRQPPSEKQLFAFEMYGVDTEGGQHVCMNWMERGPAATGLVESEWGLNSPLPAGRQLSHFEYRLRPYRHRVTFENVSLQPGRRTNAKVIVESKPEPIAGALRFADEMSLKLTRGDAHGGRWFFVDLDRGRLAKPPFTVELDERTLPFTVLSPREEELRWWMMRNSIDLMLFVEPKAFDDNSGRWQEVVTTRSIQTILTSLADPFETPHKEGEPWRYKPSPADVVAKFARRDERTRAVGFVPASSAGHSIRPDSPDLRLFRTAENVLGLYLLEHNDFSKDEFTLRIVHIVNDTTPLDDVDFDGRLVNGERGAVNPPGLEKPLVAKLPGGLDVELVGVTKVRETVYQGWTPGGSPLGQTDGWPERPGISFTPIMSGGPDPEEDEAFRRIGLQRNGIRLRENHERNLLLRMRGLKSKPSFRFVDLKGHTGWAPLPQADPYQNRLAMKLDEPADETTLTLDITDEPWGPWQQVGPDGKRLNSVEAGNAYKKHYQQISVLGVGAATAETPNAEIRFDWPRNHLEVFDVQVKAVDIDGKEADGVNGFAMIKGIDGRTSQAMRPVHEIPLDRLARFEYRLRPYRHRVTFENVTLQPGRRSQPSVKVELLSEIASNLSNVQRPDAAKVVHPNPMDVRGLDLSRVKVRPIADALESTPDLHIPDPENPGAWTTRKNVYWFPLAERTQLRYPAGSEHFYIEHQLVRADGTPESEQLYGPIDGDPFEVLKLDDLIRERMITKDPFSDSRFWSSLMFATGHPELIRRAWRFVEPELKQLVAERSANGTDPRGPAQLAAIDERLHDRIELLERARSALRSEADAFRKPELVDVAVQMRDAIAAAEEAIDAHNDSVPDTSYNSVTYRQAELPTHISETLWGKPVDGLRLALVPHGEPQGTTIAVEPSQELGYDLLVENVSGHEIKLSGHLVGMNSDGIPEVVDHDSRPIQTSGTFTSIYAARSYVRLKPGERQLISMSPVRFYPKSDERPSPWIGHTVKTAGGDYALRGHVTFGDLDNNRHRYVPGKSEWIGQLTTGWQRIQFVVPGDEPAELDVRHADGSAAIFNSVVQANIGFAALSRKPWIGRARSDGSVSLQTLPPGTHWLLAASTHEYRTLFPVTIPAHPRRLERRLHAARGWSERDIEVNAVVNRDSADGEVINVLIRNKTKSPIHVSEEDLCLGTKIQGDDFVRILSPRWTTADHEPFPQLTIAAGETGRLRLNWGEWVRQAFWISRRNESIDESILDGEEPGMVKLNVRISNIGAPWIAATDPSIILSKQTPPGPGAEPDKTTATIAFLTRYPKLHELSLKMTEEQFLEIAERGKLKKWKTTDGERTAYMIPLGDDHTLRVSFHRGDCSGIQRLRGEQLGPIGVHLKLSRQEFLLGESIPVEYVMTNNGADDAPYNRGAFYHDSRINSGFRMSAVPVDVNGKSIADPIRFPAQAERFDGPIGGFTLKPHEDYRVILFVTRHLPLLQPGRYRLRVENIGEEGRQPATVYSMGETYFTLKEPTAQEARGVFERMKKAPRRTYDENAMRFLPDAADFRAMHQPVYLPILEEYALQGDRDALESLEGMESLKASEVLVAVVGMALDRDDWRLARASFQRLKGRLPFPNWYDEPLAKEYTNDRDRVARTWKSEFRPALTRLARRLNREVTAQMQDRKTKPPDADANDREFLRVFRNGYFPPEHPQALLIDVDYIYKCAGQSDDFSDFLAAYAQSIELTKTLPLETRQYQRPRGSAYGFRHTTGRMLRRGAQVANPPRHPGEAAAFAIALRTQATFRPEGWQAELMKWLKSDSPYLAELILEHLPEPVPGTVLDYLPMAMANDYIDLQIAACHVARKHPRPAYRDPLKRILDAAKDEYLRKYAVDAARANGLKAEFDANAPFVDQPPKDAETSRHDPSAVRPPTLEEIQEFFARKVSLQANGMPLREALAELARQAGVGLHLDAEALNAVDLDLDAPVTAEFSDESLSDAVRGLIDWREHRGVYRELRDGKLVLTTFDAMQARLRAVLPDWLKPLQNHGLLTTVNDNHQVVAIHAGDVLTDELLARVAALPDLLELNLGSTTKISPAGLAHLAEMMRLEKLTLANVSFAREGLGDEALKQLVGLKALRELDVIECGTTDAGVRLIEQLPQLTHLTLHQEGGLTDDALKSIGTLTRLKHLGLSSYVRTEQYGLMHFSAAGLRSLSGLHDLEELHLVGQEVTAELLAFPRLTSLSLGGPTVDDACAEKIASRRNLHDLSLVYTGMTDAGLSRIATLPALRRLSIDSYVITDAGIEYLKSAKSLEHLSLRAARLSDESLRHIAEMKSLTRLDLSGSGEPGFMATGDLFSIHAIANLKSLPQLRTLYLTNVHSTGSFLPLRELKQVREISMMMANISESELEELEAALPKAWISNTTGSTRKVSKPLRQRRAQPAQPVDEAQPNTSRTAPK